MVCGGGPQVLVSADSVRPQEAVEPEATMLLGRRGRLRVGDSVWDPRRFLDLALHLGYCPSEPDEDCAAYDRMADVQFSDALQRGDRLDVHVVQGMPSIEPHSCRHDLSAGDRDPAQLCADGVMVKALSVVMEDMGEGAGVNFTHDETGICGCIDLVLVCVDERTNLDSRVLESGHDVSQACPLCGHIKTAFGGDLVAALGHEGRHVRSNAPADFDDLFRSAHLHIQFHLAHGLDSLHVVVLHVPAIFAQMHRDAISASQLRFHGCPNRVGFVRPPRLANRGHMVNIDSQFDHGCQITTEDIQDQVLD